MISDERRLEPRIAENEFQWHELCGPTSWVGVVWPGIPVLPVLWFAIYYNVSAWCAHPALPTGLPSYFEIFLWSGAAIPFLNYMGCRSLLVKDSGASRHRAPGVYSKFVAVGNGFALGTGLLWSLLAAAGLNAVAWHAFCGNWIIYAILLAPIAALVGSLVVACAINAKADKAHAWKLQAFSCLGLLFSCALFVAPNVNYFAHSNLVLSAKCAKSNNERRTAVRLLRTFGNLDDVLRGCYGVFGTGLPAAQLSSSMVSLTDYRDVYYRVTGRSFNEVAIPAECSQSSFWDQDLARDMVGGATKDVVAQVSSIRGEVSAQAKVAYLEWEMTFTNTTDQPKEARAQIKLPAGSVVSRAVLWMNGVQKEATFADRTRARDAYRSAVVVQRRDPLLVSYHGADRLLVQCFPVPVKASNSNIRLLIGIAVPVSRMGADGKSVLTMPKIVEANFKQIEPTIDVVSRDDLKNGRGQAPPLQSGKQLQNSGHQRRRFFVVIDGGRELAKHRQELAKSVASLAAFGKTEVLFASDEVSGIADLTDGGTPASVAVSQFGKLPFVGGPDNGAAIERAVGLARRQANSTVVWLHGPQPQRKLDLDLVAGGWQENFDAQFVDIDVQPGPMNCSESLKALWPTTWDRTDSPLSDDVSALARSIVYPAGDAPGAKQDECVCKLFQKRPALALAARRLNDMKTVDQLLRKNLTLRASDWAQHVGLVSPVTSAVVLETDSQYLNFGIEPRAHREARELQVAQNSPGQSSPAQTGPKMSSNPVQAQLDLSTSSITNQLNSLNCYSATTSNSVSIRPTSTNARRSDTPGGSSQGQPVYMQLLVAIICFVAGLFVVKRVVGRLLR